MSQLRAYAQLMRLPNVFTAIADIVLGALAAAALPARGLRKSQTWPAPNFQLSLCGVNWCRPNPSINCRRDFRW